MAKIHGIITEDGVVPNTIPELAVADFYVRATSKSYLEELSRRVSDCARAGALATGAKVEISNFEANGSTDVGNVSHVCPTIHPSFDITAPNECYATHTAGFRDATLREPAKVALEKNVCALAMIGKDIIDDPALLQQIKQEFKNAVAND